MEFIRLLSVKVFQTILKCFCIFRRTSSREEYDVNLEIRSPKLRYGFFRRIRTFVS